jgi:indole-3-glycerol phosphate synthase
LSRALSAGDRAAAYQAAGAAMVSVLTDGRWFDGSLADLRAARERTTVPVLCKEFVIDPLQIDHAWAAGADAVLIIVRCVGDQGTLAGLIAAARERGVEPFVEVVTERELERAVEGGARVIGVNARDLDTLEMDLARAARVLAAIPNDRIAVRLSGLRTPIDAAAVAQSRADAALIGEALMRHDDPSGLLADLVAGASARSGEN